MRFIHTADWHLGRILFGVHLTDDQEYLLNQIKEIIIQKKAEALIIAGDIYDRAVPPPSAIKLLDRFVSEIIHQVKIPVIMISGNHDSPDRLGFASDILEKQGLFIKGSVFSDSFVTSLKDEFGTIDIYSAPYAEPVVVREKLQDESLLDHNLAVKALVDDILKKGSEKNRKILIGHAFVAGGSETESERPLSVGGSGAVSPSVFKGFDYVALGHLHRSQKAGNSNIRYSGSILPYSFEEGTIEKSVTLVDLGEKGYCKFETIPLVPKRKLRKIKGEIEEIIKSSEEITEDYIQVTLLDKGPVLDAMGKLREKFPNVLHIERPYLVSNNTSTGLKSDHRKLNEKELFSLFFKEVTGEKTEKELEEKFIEIVDGFKMINRETGE